MPKLTRILIFTLTSSLAAVSHARTLPDWVTSSQTIDGPYLLVICSGEGVDTQALQETTEAKCISSAAKLGGVTVNLRSKTVESLSGTDSSEVAEIVPITKFVNCTFSDRYLELIPGQGFRLFLRCRVKRTSLRLPESSPDAFTAQTLVETLPIARSGYKVGMATITSLPKADVILIGGATGERAVNVKSNVMTVELRSGDESLLAKKLGYEDQRIKLEHWTQGDTLNLTVRFRMLHSVP